MTTTPRFAWAIPTLLVGCSDPRPAAGAPVSSTTAPTMVPSASEAPRALPTPSTGPGAPASSDGDTRVPVATATPEERFYPGADSARVQPRKRYPTAVLLFAPPREDATEPPAQVRTVAFQPIVCAVGGKLRAGLPCGEAMPARATVRLTTTSSGQDTLEIARSTAAFTADPEDGRVTYPAPYAAACCMYKQCQGKTIPYRPLSKQAAALATTKTILAVWPADAEIDLATMTSGTDIPTRRSWKVDAFGPRRILQLSASDLDHDGRPEIIAYEWWANDYGLDIFDGTTLIHRFSCGNI